MRWCLGAIGTLSWTLWFALELFTKLEALEGAITNAWKKRLIRSEIELVLGFANDLIMAWLTVKTRILIGKSLSIGPVLGWFWALWPSWRGSVPLQTVFGPFCMCFWARFCRRGFFSAGYSHFKKKKISSRIHGIWLFLSFLVYLQKSKSTHWVSIN